MPEINVNNTDIIKLERAVTNGHILISNSNLPLEATEEILKNISERFYEGPDSPTFITNPGDKALSDKTAAMLRAYVSNQEELNNKAPITIDDSNISSIMSQANSINIHLGRINEALQQTDHPITFEPAATYLIAATTYIEQKKSELTSIIEQIRLPEQSNSLEELQQTFQEKVKILSKDDQITFNDLYKKAIDERTKSELNKIKDEIVVVLQEKSGFDSVKRNELEQSFNDKLKSLSAEDQNEFKTSLTEAIKEQVRKTTQQEIDQRKSEIERTKSELTGLINNIESVLEKGLKTNGSFDSDERKNLEQSFREKVNTLPGGDKKTDGDKETFIKRFAETTIEAVRQIERALCVKYDERLSNLTRLEQEIDRLSVEKSNAMRGEMDFEKLVDLTTKMSLCESQYLNAVNDITQEDRAQMLYLARMPGQRQISEPLHKKIQELFDAEKNKSNQPKFGAQPDQTKKEAGVERQIEARTKLDSLRSSGAQTNAPEQPAFKPPTFRG